MSRILVVEDDAAILRGLADNLACESHDVLTATDGERACSIVRDQKPDLVILDLMLPRMSGYDVCRTLRGEGVTTPILMLTARGDESDRVLGLDLGADDYLTKPFSIRELLARVRALLRRTQAAASSIDVLQFEDTFIDFKRYDAQRAGAPIDMTKKEVGVLRYLAARAGEVVTREELLDQVGGYDAMPTTRTVDNHIASLRAKLEADPSQPRHLQTVHGVGYKWVP
jgi:DNA-binding response OmpR family regulator